MAAQLRPATAALVHPCTSDILFTDLMDGILIIFNNNIVRYDDAHKPRRGKAHGCVEQNNEGIWFSTADSLFPDSLPVI